MVTTLREQPPNKFGSIDKFGTLDCRRFGVSRFWMCRRFGFVAVLTCRKQYVENGLLLTSQQNVPRIIFM